MTCTGAPQPEVAAAATNRRRAESPVKDFDTPAAPDLRISLTFKAYPLLLPKIRQGVLLCLNHYLL